MCWSDGGRKGVEMMDFLQRGGREDDVNFERVETWGGREELTQLKRGKSSLRWTWGGRGRKGRRKEMGEGRKLKGEGRSRSKKSTEVIDGMGVV